VSKVNHFILSVLSFLMRLIQPQNLKNQLAKQEGQTWMEYGMIIGGTILIIVLVIALFGDKLMNLFNDIASAIGIRQPSGGSGGW
jgi:Flp pilus assembly pilin Flp